MTQYPEELLKYAGQCGATGACFVAPSELVVEERLAKLCLQPRCPNYGLSASCPPHVQGPSQFRTWCKEAEQALALKIDLPAAILHSTERFEVMRLLHEIVAGTERLAVELHFPHSKGFAGGSCKHLFCQNEDGCLYLTEKKSCRNPQHARPSMSGFGINVASLMHSAGWDARTLNESESDGESMSWVAGLVLLCR